MVSCLNCCCMQHQPKLPDHHGTLPKPSMGPSYHNTMPAVNRIAPRRQRKTAKATFFQGLLSFASSASKKSLQLVLAL